MDMENNVSLLDPSAQRGAQSVIVSFVSVAIAFVILVCRIYTRVSIVRAIGPEDYVIVASLAFSFALSGLIYVEFQHGQGRHIATISDRNKMILFRALYASIPIYSTALTLTKVSILLQYWRVFVSATVRRIVLVLFAITVISGLWATFGTIFMCTPISYFWNPSLPNGHCLDKHAVWFANASLNIITDLAIFILPMPVFHDLHLPRRQRIALMAVFGLGAFVVLTSILRLKSLYKISVSTDVTWDNGGAAAWSSLEVNVGIICASLPTLRKTVSRFFPKVFSATGSSSAQKVGSRGCRSERLGFRRFPVAQEAEEWARVSRRLGAYAGEVQVESGAGSVHLMEEGLRTSGGGEAEVVGQKGKIMVLTVTTQEVMVAEPERAATPSGKALSWGKRMSDGSGA